MLIPSGMTKSPFSATDMCILFPFACVLESVQLVTFAGFSVQLTGMSPFFSSRSPVKPLTDVPAANESELGNSNVSVFLLRSRPAPTPVSVTEAWASSTVSASSRGSPYRKFHTCTTAACNAHAPRRTSYRRSRQTTPSDIRGNSRGRWRQWRSGMIWSPNRTRNPLILRRPPPV